jgi:hypothetical protein
VNHQSQAIKMAVSPPLRALKRARFLFDLALIAMGPDNQQLNNRPHLLLTRGSVLSSLRQVLSL